MHYFLDKQSFAHINSIIPLFTELQHIVGKLEANDATLLDAWYYLVKLMPKYDYIESFAISYNNRFRSQLNNLHAIDVLVYLTLSYDHKKIGYLAKCCGIEIPTSMIETYHAKAVWFEKRTPIPNLMPDLSGSKIDHIAPSKKYFWAQDLVIVQTISVPYSKLSQIPISEASAERVFSALKRAIGASVYRSSYGFLQSKLILAAAERSLSPEVYREIRKAKEKCGYSSLYESCYAFQVLESPIEKNEYCFKTPLSS